MALVSRLFRGDPKLEAAAISDPAHIAPGSSGDHVRKIQLALIQLDGAAISSDGKYGPATAAAVLAYKRKRGIINPAYQTQADNIVGKMTIAALDKEVLASENIFAPLNSELFRGDSRLEDLVRNAADGVSVGDQGEFVSKIQYAVLVFEEGRIGPFELKGRFYGEETARVVFAYKMHRGIINSAEPSPADQSVERVTIRSLDFEMVAFETQEKLAAFRSR